MPDLRAGLDALYPPAVAAALEQRLLTAAARAYAAAARPTCTASTRRARWRPDWFQAPSILGYAAYADRFGGDLAGVAEADPVPARSSASPTCT